MPDPFVPIEIPNRALFKAAEVCEIVKVQPYVLRSWEMEFPDLGIARTAGGPRVYRRVDVERVARIKHLLLVEGLTLAGVRRKLDEEAAPVGAGAPLDELIGQNARDRLTEVKRGLQGILDLLSSRPTPGEAAPPARIAAASQPKTLALPAARGRARRAPRSRSARRKRSA